MYGFVPRVFAFLLIEQDILGKGQAVDASPPTGFSIQTVRL
jgi:hypothetical protein